MTRNEAIEGLKKCQTSVDTEKAHVIADSILCAMLSERGYEDVVSEYEKIGKWYG